MASIVKASWFGRRLSVLMVNDKTVTGTLSEVTDRYIILTRGGSETQIMSHAIIAVRPAEEEAPD